MRTLTICKHGNPNYPKSYVEYAVNSAACRPLHASSLTGPSSVRDLRPSSIVPRINRSLVVISAEWTTANCRVSCVTTRKPIIRHLRYATNGSHFSTADRSWLVFLNQMISRQMWPLLTHNRRLFSS